MDKHTLRIEEQTITRSIDIARISERYHLAGAQREHDRQRSLQTRLHEIRFTLATADDSCDCPA